MVLKCATEIPSVILVFFVVEVQPGNQILQKRLSASPIAKKGISASPIVKQRVSASLIMKKGVIAGPIIIYGDTLSRPSMNKVGRGTSQNLRRSYPDFMVGSMIRY
jgi:hypothetical protein